MPDTMIEMLPAKQNSFTPFFPTEEAYLQFRDDFEESVKEEQEKWLEARRLSEEDARNRVLR